MKKEIIALIIGFALLILLFVAVGKADPTTAPTNNIVRIYIDSVVSGRYATGFILEKGKIVTAKHVVSMAEKQLIIQYKNGIFETIPKKKFNVSKLYDLALAKTKRDRASRKLRLSDSGHFIGKKIYTVGFPGGFNMMWVSTGTSFYYINIREENFVPHYNIWIGAWNICDAGRNDTGTYPHHIKPTGETDSIYFLSNKMTGITEF